MPNSDGNDLYNLALQMVNAKVTASEPLKKEMAMELAGKIEDTINLELLSRMSKEQMDMFNELLDSDQNSDEQIIEFVKKCDIDIDNVTTVALTKVRFAYMGA